MMRELNRVLVQSESIPPTSRRPIPDTTPNLTVPVSSPGPGKMDELRTIAMLHYKAASPRVQGLAQDFFKSMDSDGDGQVDVEEFLSFMSAHLQPGCWGYRQFFKELDADGNGSLDFWEVMTFYYVIKSGRPNCDRCGDLIPGVFFSCVPCYMAGGNSFDLCIPCYRSAPCSHTHNGTSNFLDNYTLLRNLRPSSDSLKPEVKPSSSTAVVVAAPSQQGGANATFKVLQAALNVANVTATLSQCTIL